MWTPRNANLSEPGSEPPLLRMDQSEESTPDPNISFDLDVPSIPMLSESQQQDSGANDTAFKLKPRLLPSRDLDCARVTEDMFESFDLDSSDIHKPDVYKPVAIKHELQIPTNVRPTSDANPQSAQCVQSIFNSCWSPGLLSAFEKMCSDKDERNG
jgi:hypothetical protein